jgi:putative ATPase
MTTINHKSPLADRLRPRNLSEYLGQQQIVGEGKFLRQALDKGTLPSLILWGPPGTGKTTLALILASAIKAEFVRFSAVTEGVKDLRSVIDKARNNQLLDQRTILFIDEIHRWNKAQQDALLPHLENGTIILVGATTENPSFEIRNALLSRCRVLVLQSLASTDLIAILRQALSDDRGLADQNINLSDEAATLIAELSGGDARSALNILEAASLMSADIDRAIILEAAHKAAYHDKAGESHYNLISALHKSLRGSDADAALYWLARLIVGGEDPMYIVRRLVRFASEDIGLANSKALEQAIATYQAVHLLGLPECNVHLAQLVVYLAKCQKSNALYTATAAATDLAQSTSHLPVPLHLRNAPTSLMKDLGYGAGYQYSPDHDYQESQIYLPDELVGKKFIKTN